MPWPLLTPVFTIRHSSDHHLIGRSVPESPAVQSDLQSTQLSGNPVVLNTELVTVGKTLFCCPSIILSCCVSQDRIVHRHSNRTSLCLVVLDNKIIWGMYLKHKIPNRVYAFCMLRLDLQEESCQHVFCSRIALDHCCSVSVRGALPPG